MVHCFYHNDLDGHCAGAIVKLRFVECAMHEVAYGCNFDKEVKPHVVRGDSVYIVDFAFDEKDMLYLDKIASVYWLDHHSTKIETLKACKNFKGTRDTAYAGCELTWQYLHSHEAMPIAVYYIGRWDVWDHRNNNTIPFHRGMETMITDPAKPAAMFGWDDVFENNRDGHNADWNVVDQVLNIGLISESMKARYDEFIATSAYYIPDWEGHRTVALNSKVLDSYCVFEVDELYAPFDPEILIWYSQSPDGNWKYSIRAYPGTMTDVGSIAQKFGGGGHATAAGFTTKELIIKPTIKSRKWALIPGMRVHNVEK